MHKYELLMGQHECHDVPTQEQHDTIQGLLDQGLSRSDAFKKAGVKKRTYKAFPDEKGPGDGRIIETDQILENLNGVGMQPKFLKLDLSHQVVEHPLAKQAQETPAQYAARLRKAAEVVESSAPTATATTSVVDHMATFRDMTVKELQAWCGTYEVDLGGARNKEEILRVIEASGLASEE